jgi:RNA ligase
VAIGPKIKLNMENLAELDQLIAEGYISVQAHPGGELFIYNYTPKAQYEQRWNQWTLACRGLILDRQRQVVARPFGKFFNLEEHAQARVPAVDMDGAFEVYEKMDGSLGILYQSEGRFAVATRGSFQSEQAVKATAILHQKYAAALAQVPPGKTFLFEIIYPANRIVVDYGGLEDLVLLAVIDNQTGRDEPLPAIGFPLVPRHDGIRDLATIRQWQTADREGFVIKFASGFRVKVKFDEYVRLHRLLTNVSSRHIWEYLAAGQPLAPLLERVPDEFYAWVKQQVAQLEAQYQQIEQQGQRALLPNAVVPRHFVCHVGWP